MSLFEIGKCRNWITLVSASDASVVDIGFHARISQDCEGFVKVTLRPRPSHPQRNEQAPGCDRRWHHRDCAQSLCRQLAMTLTGSPSMGRTVPCVIETRSRVSAFCTSTRLSGYFFFKLLQRFRASSASAPSRPKAQIRSEILNGVGIVVQLHVRRRTIDIGYGNREGLA